MSESFDQRWASERLLDFALTFDAASAEMSELRQANVSAQRIFSLYPVDTSGWIQPLQSAFANDVVAKAIWLESNTFDSYRHILKRISSEENIAAEWHAMLWKKDASIAAKNAAWNVAVFLTVLKLLAETVNWQHLRHDATLTSRMSDFEDVIRRVLHKVAAAR